MINYSTCMRGNPTDKDAAKKAYANAQYSQVMTLDKFCYHIALQNQKLHMEKHPNDICPIECSSFFINLRL